MMPPHSSHHHHSRGGPAAAASSMSAWSSAVLDSIPHQRRLQQHHEQQRTSSSQRYQPQQQQQPTIVVHSPHPVTINGGGGGGQHARSSSPPTRSPSSALPSPPLVTINSSGLSSGGVSGIAGTATSVAELSGAYHALLGQASLQAAQLEGARTEAAARDATLRALSEGLAALWNNIEQRNRKATAAAATQQQLPHKQQPWSMSEPDSPPTRSTYNQSSSSRFSASSTAAAQVYPLPSPSSSSSSLPLPSDASRGHQVVSLLSALCSGALSASDASALVGLMGHEVSGAFSRAEAVVSAATSEAHEGRQRLAGAFLTARQHALRRRILHAWVRSALDAQHQLAVAKVQSKAAQAHTIAYQNRLKARCFKSWSSFAARRAAVHRSAATLIRSRTADSLRSAYLRWRLASVARGRQAVLSLHASLAARSQVLDGVASKDGWKDLAKFLQMTFLRSWVRQLKAKEVAVRTMRARRILARWAALASARRARVEALRPLLKRLETRRKLLAINEWTAGVNRAKQKRLHVLAYAVELAAGSRQRARNQRLARALTAWVAFTRTKQRAEEQAQSLEVQHQMEQRFQSREEDLRVEVQRGMAQRDSEHARDLEALQVRLRAEMDEVLRVAQSESDKRLRDLAGELERAQDAWVHERRDLKASQVLALDQLEARHARDSKHLRQQVQDLTLDKKHVVLEMKHQAHVHAEEKDRMSNQAKQIGGGGTGGSGAGGSVSGVLFPHEMPPQTHMGPTVFTNGSAGGAGITLPYGVAAGVAHFTTAPASAPVAAAVGDPYLSSPLFQHHVAESREDRHRAEVGALASREKEMLVSLTELRARLASVTNLYQLEHKQVRKLKGEALERVRERAKDSSAELAAAEVAQHHLREALADAKHSLDLAKFEQAVLREKMEALTLAKDSAEATSADSLAKLLEARERIGAQAAQQADLRLEEASKARLQEQEALQRQADAHRDDIAKLRAEHAAALEHAKSESDQRLRTVESHHSEKLEGLQSHFDTESSAMLACIDTLKLEALQAQERIRELQADLQRLKDSRDAADKNRAHILDRNRKLAAALVEENHNDHTILTHVMEPQPHPQPHRPPPEHRNNAATAAASTISGPFKSLAATTSAQAAPAAAPSSSSSVSSASSELRHLFGHAAAAAGAGPYSSATAAGVPAFGGAAASLPTKLSLTPVNSLRFSPVAPGTPPLLKEGSMANQPWPKPTPHATTPDMDLAAEAEATVAAAAAAAMPHYPSPFAYQHQQQQQYQPPSLSPSSHRGWLHSPPPAAVGFAPSVLQSPTRQASGGYVPARAPAPSSRSFAAAAPPLRSALRSPLATTPLSLLSPPLSTGSASRMDVARVFQQGLAQF